MVEITKEVNGYSVFIPSDGGKKRYVYNTFKEAAKRIGKYFGHPKEPVYEVPAAPAPAPVVETPRPDLIENL